MMTTANLNLNKNFDEKDLIRASEVLKAHKIWYIFTHKKSDGDAMGSASALFESGVNLGKSVKWFSPDKTLPEVYKFLPHSNEFIFCEEFNFGEFTPPSDKSDTSPQAERQSVASPYYGEEGHLWRRGETPLYVFLDCSNEVRSVSGFDVSKNINALNIDHHEDNSLFGRVNCVDGLASSTCEMLFRIFMADNWEITQNIAESLYTGIFTDTGGFAFSNTSAKTHMAASKLIELGVKPDKISDFINQNKTPQDFLIWARAMSRTKVFGEGNIFAVSVIYAKDFEETGAELNGTEGLSSMLMTIEGVKLISTITQYPSGEIRLSIRSREGSPIGAGELARIFGGGGHERAAGATFNFPIENAVNELEKIILNKYHECVNPD